MSATSGQSALEHFANEKAFEEIYEVVKTALIVHNGRFFRIEVLKSYWNPKIPYLTRAYVEDRINGKDVSVDYALPWTNRNDADSALWQALGFLAAGERG